MRDLSLLERMAATLGKIDGFDCKDEEWAQYEERLEFANEIVDDGKKRSILITVIGNKTLKLLRSLVHPQKPDKTFEELTAALKFHFVPPPSKIMQRFPV